MSGEAKPLALTLETAVLELSVRFWSLKRWIDGRWWVENDERGDNDFSRLERTGFATWPEAVSAVLGRPVVARDETAELRAAIQRVIQNLENADLTTRDAPDALLAEVWALRRLVSGEEQA